MCVFQFLKPEGMTALFTGVLTLATIFYVVFTFLLWRETKKSADAAAKLAQAAKDSADMAAELNRPILGIAEVTLVEVPGAHLPGVRAIIPGVRQIIVTLQNYGTFYAKGVLLEWKAYMQATNETRNDSRQGPIDIAHGATCPINLSVSISPDDVARISKGGANYKIQIQAEYSTPDEQRRWKYTAVRVLSPPSTFTMDDQTPDRTDKIT